MVFYLVLALVGMAIAVIVLGVLEANAPDPAYAAYLALSRGEFPDAALYPVIINGAEACVAAWEAPTVMEDKVYVGGVEVPVPGYAPRRAAAVWGPCPSR